MPSVNAQIKDEIKPSLLDIVLEFITLEEWNSFVEVELRGVLDVQSSHAPEFESAPAACLPVSLRQMYLRSQITILG